MILIICVVAVVGGLLYMLWLEPNRLIQRHVHLYGKIKSDLCIVHFTDLHVHHDLTARKWQRLIQAIQGCNPDLIIFSGDLMDCFANSVHLREQLVPYLKQLEARLGKLCVYGNHDIGGQAKDVYPLMMKEAGFQVLCNQSICYSQLDLAVFGMDDMLAGYEDLHLCDERLASYQILIAHEPDVLDRINLQGVDLMMSGHTHGAQIYLPWLWHYVLPKGGQHYRKGAYRKGNTLLYVSSGFGMTSLPMRLGNPPEIVVYHIKQKKTKKEKEEKQ